jgi:putative PIN family toxin of toxin-antitoxin system
MVLDEQLRPLISVSLVLEYEAVLTRPEHVQASDLDEEAITDLLKVIVKTGEPVHIARRLRPQLVDPNDEFVLEAAYHGKADAIVTLNTRDFLAVTARFRILTLSPAEALKRMKLP